MKAAGRWRAAAGVCGLAAALFGFDAPVTGAPLAGGAWRSVAETSRVPDRGLSLNGATFVEARQRASRASAERLRRLRAPARVAERRRSRTGYQGLTARAALGVAHRTYPRVVGARLDARGMLARQTVKRWLDPSSALVAVDGRSTALLTSSVPLATRVRGSRLKPTDHTLVDRGEHFEPKRTSFPVLLPKRAGALARMGNGEIAFRPVVAHGEVRGSASPGQLIFPNVDLDTDYVVKVIPTGLETFLHLRSARSPEVSRLRFVLRDGQSLDATAQGGALLADRKGIVARVAPPVATDADGTPVPVRLGVEGSELVVRVDHRGRDLHYPLLVDPQIDGYRWLNDQSTDFGGWVANQYRQGHRGFDQPTNPPNFWGPGLYNGAYGDAPYVAGDFAEWIYTAQAQSYIYRAEFWYVRHEPGAELNSQAFEFILDPVSATNDSTIWCRPTYSPCGPSPVFENNQLVWDTRVHCVRADCEPAADSSPSCSGAACGPAGRPGNRMQFGLYLKRPTGPSGASDYLGAAVIYAYDVDKPTVESVSHTGLPSTWTENATSNSTVTGADAGLGIKTLAVEATDGGLSESATVGCTGRHDNRCPNRETRSFTWSTHGLPEGVNDVRATAHDLIGRQTHSTPWQVKIDRTAPQVDVWGDPRDAADEWLGGGQHQVVADASDEANGQRGSGIKRAELWIDEALVDAETLDCSSDCPADANVSLEFNADTLAAGVRSFRVVVKDRLNHATEDRWQVRLDPTPPQVTQTGGLPTAASLPLLAPRYEMVTAAVDGSALQVQSGVATLTVEVNGWTAQHVEQECLEGSCSLSQTFTYDNADFGPGAQTVTTTVTDAAGNRASESFVVTDPSAITGCGGRLVSPGGQPCPENHSACTGSAAVQPTASSPPAQASEVITAHEAWARLDPRYRAGSTQHPFNGSVLEPSLMQEGAEYLATGSAGLIGVPIAAERGMQVGQGPRGVCLKPLAIDQNVTAPLIEGDVLVWANTQPAVDTVVRPTATGFKTILQIRGAGAPELFSWRVEMPEGAQLRQVDDETVAVVEGDVEPAHDTDRPATPLVPPESATDPAKVADTHAQLTDEAAEFAAAETATGERTLAVIRAPWSRDRDQRAVPTSLIVANANTLTMAVSHRGGRFQYPIAADPGAHAGHTPVRTQTWNVEFGDAKGIAPIADAIAKDGAKVIGLQDLCSGQLDQIRARLGGDSKWFRYFTPLFKNERNCWRGNGLLVSKGYGVGQYFTLSVPSNGQGPTRPCQKDSRRDVTEGQPPRPRCIHGVLVAPNVRARSFFFNVHLGRGPRRNEGAPYEYVARYVRDLTDPHQPGSKAERRKVVMGDFNVDAISEGAKLSAFLGDSRWREADSRRRPTHNSRKLDYIFYGLTPGDWAASTWVRSERRELSPHLAVLSRLSVPHY